MMSLKTLALSLFLLTLTTRTIRADDLGESDIDENEDIDMGMDGGYGGDDYGGGYGGGYGDDEYGGGGGEDTTPAFSTIDDVEGVQKFLDEDATEAAVIGFFNSDTNQEDIDAFESVAGSNKYDMRFAYSVEDDVREHFKAKSGCAVYVYKAPRYVSDKYDTKRARYPGKKVDETGLTKFFKKKSLPLVGQKTWKTNERYSETGLPILTLFTKVDLEKNPKGYDYYANRLRRVASDEEFKGKLVFNIGDKEDFSYVLEDYDISLPEKKDVGVGIMDGANHYGMTESFSVDHIKAFVKAFLAGELTPKVKEEPDYSSEDESGGGDDEEDDGSPSSVVTLTSDNFADEVTNADADVMVEFYAPWCGHCMQLKPTYKKLAAEFDDVATVKVAAMDATAHDPPKDFEVQGYPTIYFVPKGGKPVSYDGGRDLDSMVEYIKGNAVTIKDEL